MQKRGQKKANLRAPRNIISHIKLRRPSRSPRERPNLVSVAGGAGGVRGGEGLRGGGGPGAADCVDDGNGFGEGEVLDLRGGGGVSWGGGGEGGGRREEGGGTDAP